MSHFPSEIFPRLRGASLSETLFRVNLSLNVTRRGALLALILIVHLTLSLIALDWGLPFMWHTDEKLWQVVDMMQRRSLDPSYFINPSLYIYLAAAAASIAYALYPGSHVELGLPVQIQYTDPSNPGRAIQWLGFMLPRAVSVVASAATLWLLYRIGRRHFDDAVALLAGAFLAVTMGMVNMAHFATVESLLFLLTLAALGSLDPLIARGRVRDYLGAGVLIGLACSTKYTAVMLAVPLVVAHVFGRGIRKALSAAGLAKLGLCGIAVVVGFFTATPYAAIHWQDFWDHGVVFNWETGSPGRSPLGMQPTWGPYFDLLGNGLGWPLLLVSLAGLVMATKRALAGSGATPERRAYIVHATWIWSFYGFYGLSTHYALRFILPIAPSLVLLAAAFSMDLVRRSGALWKPAARVLPAVVLLYSLVYTARADAMMLHDTRYTAGKWLNEHCYPNGALDYFAIGAYLPYLDRPRYALFPVAFVNRPGIRGAEFRRRAREYLRNATNPIVDSEFYYNRFLDHRQRALWPERVEFYESLLHGIGAEGYEPAIQFIYRNPWWLNPRPERVAPEVDVFARPGTIRPCPADAPAR